MTEKVYNIKGKLFECKFKILGSGGGLPHKNDGATFWLKSGMLPLKVSSLKNSTAEALAVNLLRY